MRQMMEAGMATAHLYDIRRQKDKELLQAVRESVNGDHLKTYEALDKQGNYREVKDKAARMRSVRQEMTARSIGDYRQNLLLVSTNRDRREYNSAIRAEYVARGELEAGQNFAVTVHDGERATQEQRQLAVKDRIIFTANDRRLGVMNGTMATIEQIDGDIITARADAGKAITWNMAQYNSIDYGYAVTNYKAQGITVQKVVVDMNTRGTAQTRNALYVDISRAKCEAIVFTDDKGKLERQTRHFARKVTSKDFIAKMDAMRRRGGITNNDRYHAPNQNQGQALAKALAQIEAHTQIPDIVQRWERDIAAKHEAERIATLERQRAEEAAAKERAEQARLGQGRGRSRGFSR